MIFSIEETCIKALTMKKKAPITEEEKTKIIALGRLYNTRILTAAVHGSTTADLVQISQVCMQIGGFFNTIPTLLSGMVLTRNEARKHYGEEMVSIGDRLRKVSTSPKMEELIRISKDSLNRSAFDLWKEKTDGNENADTWLIRDMLRSYGPELTRWAIQYVPQPPYLEGEPKQFLIEFLYYSALRNVQKVSQLLSHTNVVYDLNNLSEAPIPRNMKINRYFWAVTGRAPNDEESCMLWDFQAFYIENDILFEITAIPASEFNLLKVNRALQKRYRKQKLPSACAYWQELKPNQVEEHK